MVRLLDAFRRRSGRSIPEASENANALDAVAANASKISHDLNNLLLVVSMESAHISEVAGTDPEVRKSVDALEQVVREGRKIAERTAGIAVRHKSESAAD